MEVLEYPDTTSPPRPVYLAKFRESRRMRAHFGIFIPNATEIDHVPEHKGTHCIGHLTHVTGTPFTGYFLEYKRNFDITAERDFERAVRIGEIEGCNVVDPDSNSFFRSQNKLGKVDAVAESVTPPGPNADTRAPVNETTNRRCQEWTMEFVRKLADAKVRFIREDAIAIVQSERDRPTHGIVLLRPEYRIDSDVTKE